MGNTDSAPNNFKWDPASAARKAASDCYISVGTSHLSVTKYTGETNRERDAYRNCQNCKRHFNYHRDGRCPCN